jgi:Ser/Thr protein kinase RdoA (MazF antagonist)
MPALNEKELLEFVRRHASLAPAEVLDGDFRITRLDRRNRNYRIEAAGSRGLFIKQGSALAAAGSMAQEAALYELFALSAVHARAAKHLIRCLGHDAKACLLVLEAVPNAEDLHQYYLRTVRLLPSLGAELGVALGTLHRATRFLAAEPASARSIGEVRPWVFDLPCPDVRLLREASATNLSVIRLLQRKPVFAREFASLTAAWRTESVVHGDLKLANCLTHPSGRKRGPRGLKLVDWEFGGFGDPRWDVASVFASYLALWVCAIPMPEPARPDLLAATARFPLLKVQHTLRHFLERYAAAAELDPRELPGWLGTAVRMTSARLVQTAYEYATSAAELTAPILTLVQLALNVLERPERATADLLGFRTSSPSREARSA